MNIRTGKRMSRKTTKSYTIIMVKIAYRSVKTRRKSLLHNDVFLQMGETDYITAEAQRTQRRIKREIDNCDNRKEDSTWRGGTQRKAEKKKANPDIGKGKEVKEEKDKYIGKGEDGKKEFIYKVAEPLQRICGKIIFTTGCGWRVEKNSGCDLWQGRLD